MDSLLKLEKSIRTIKPKNLIASYPYNSLNNINVINTKKKIELIYNKK